TVSAREAALVSASYVESRLLLYSMPRPVEALPCGSRSTISTRSSIAASAVPRLMAVVVLPTPPFWLAIARTRGRCGEVKLFEIMVNGPLTARNGLFHDHDPAAGIGDAWPHAAFDDPRFSGLGQFLINILSLKKKPL